MKIKPVYLYIGIAILAVAFLIFFSTKDESVESKNIVMNKMPDDDIHKGLKDQMQAPGKGNVSGEIKQQLEMLEKAVEENPEDTLKIREYADLLAAAHRSDEAIIYYYNILNINPGRTDILFSLAFIYYNKKNYEKAEDIIDKVLLYEPANTQAMYNLGAIAAANGNKEKAKNQWENLVKKYPGSDASKLAQSSLRKL